MRRSAILAAGFLFLVGVYFLVIRSPDKKSIDEKLAHESSRAEKSSGRTPSAGEDETSGGEHGSENDGERAAEKKARPIHVSGIVVDNGVPAADAIVIAAGADNLSAKTTSGADGRFTFDLEARGWLHIEAVKGTNRRGNASLGLREDPPELRIELKAAGSVIVTVTSARDHAPVEGARVSSELVNRGDAPFTERHFGPVETDAEGKTTLFVSRNGEYEVAAEDDELGFTSGVIALELSDEPAHFALELRGGSAVIGHVVDEHGPVENAFLWLVPQDVRGFSGRRRTKSTADGSFRIGGVNAGVFKLIASSPAHPQKEIDLEKKDETNDLSIEVVLSTGGTIAGRVVDAGERPLQGWGVFAMAVGGRPFEHEKAISAEDGAFLLRGLKEGDYTLVLGRPKEEAPRAIFAPKTDAPRVHTGEKDVVLHAPAGATLEGEVLFDSHEVPATYSVDVNAKKKDFPGTTPTFRLTDLDDGEIRVYVRASGFAPASETVKLIEGQTARASFTLRAGLSVRGRVVDKQSGAPIAKAIISPTQGATPNRSMLAVYSNEAGEFTIDGASEGPMTLQVRARGYAQTTSGPHTIAREAPELTVQLGAGTVITGRVHSGQETSTGGVLLQDPSAPTFPPPHPVMIDPKGNFSITDVAPGPHKLFVTSKHGSKVVSVDVPATGLQDLDIDLAADNSR